MLDFIQFQLTDIKRLAMFVFSLKTSRIVIISGIGIGIGSALFINWLKQYYGKARTMGEGNLSLDQEKPDADENVDNDDREHDNGTAATDSTPPRKQLSTTSETLLILKSSHEAFSSETSASDLSQNQAAVDAQVSEIAVKPLSEIELPDVLGTTEVYEGDCIVVIPKKDSRPSTIDLCSEASKISRSNADSDFEEDENSNSEALDSERNSSTGTAEVHHNLPTISETSEWVNSVRASLGSFSNSSLAESQLENDQSVDVAEDFRPEKTRGRLSLDSLASPASWLIRKDKNDSCESFLLTSFDVKSIFGDESLLECESEFLEKLADIERNLCFVQDDTEDMMIRLHTLRDDQGAPSSESTEAGHAESKRTSTPTKVLGDAGKERIVDRLPSEPHHQCPGEPRSTAEPQPMNDEFLEWDFEEQLGCGEISF